MTYSVTASSIELVLYMEFLLSWLPRLPSDPVIDPTAGPISLGFLPQVASPNPPLHPRLPSEWPCLTWELQEIKVV